MNRFVEIILFMSGIAVRHLMKAVRPGARFGRWLFRGKVMAVLLPLGAVGFLVYAWVMLTGPRMRSQPHILPYERVLQPPPEGTVPVEATPLWPASDSLPEGTAGISDSATGRVYYGYYCIFCHGEKNALGPVGMSFVPTPPSLSMIARQHWTNDSALVRAMMTGAGHEPLLHGVVSPVHHRYIAGLIRDLGSNKRQTDDTVGLRNP